MRVISQRGNVDLPYEQIVVCSEMEYVMAVHKEKEYVLGKYSSDDKAVKAMEMLRKAWKFETGIYHRNIIFQFPKDDDERLN